MLQGTTKISRTDLKRGKGVYRRFFIHVPGKIASDSQFPFKGGEVFDIQVSAKAIVLKLAGKGKAKK